MSSLNRFALLTIALLSLAFLAACSSGPAKGLPPPTGGFVPGNLKGTYVFSTQGFDFNGEPIAMAGAFTANGSLGITGGTIDIIDAEFTSPFADQTISGGSYTMGADGRGTVILTTSTATPFGSQAVELDFVLATPSQGLVTEFDANGTGSGTLDLQSSATVSGPYAFNLSGFDLVGGGILATVGSFTVGTDGSITTGVQDFNDNNVFTSYPLSGGSVTLGSGSAPGTATLTTTGAFGTLGFDVYPVDSTHLKFIETSGNAFLAGDAFTQQGASLPTTAAVFAFTMGGEVVSAGTGTPLAIGGLMAIDGAGNITSSSEVDINNALAVTTGQVFGGTYAASGSIGGRTLFNVSGFSVAIQFVAYPTFNAGLQMLESDGVGFLDGAALAQTTTTAIAESQGYAMNLSAANGSTGGGEEDDIAEFSTTSNTFSGIIDINDDMGTTPSLGERYTGSYTVDSPATGRGEITRSNYNLGIFYAVDSSTLLFLDANDDFLVGVGVLLEQNASGSSSAAAKRLIAPHHVLLPRSAKAPQPGFRRK
jgi:hypothetical protein